jgi:hypothetical protein
MTIPTAAMSALLDAADYTPLSNLVSDHGRDLVGEAADRNLIRISGGVASIRWGLDSADSIQQQRLLVVLTDNGLNYQAGA